MREVPHGRSTSVEVDEAVEGEDLFGRDFGVVEVEENVFGHGGQFGTEGSSRLTDEGRRTLAETRLRVFDAAL